jgi:hypothetical protein
MIGDILQILIAIILIVLLALIAYSIYNSEIRDMVFDITKKVVVKKRTDIFKGIFSYDAQVKYNTSNSKYGDYRAIEPSMNQKGGAEYSYNFWLYKSQENDQDDVVLFLRGSNKKVRYTAHKNCKTLDDAGWFIVKNPLVRLFKQDGQSHGLVVEFNGIDEPDSFQEGSYDPNCGGTQLDQNQPLLGVQMMDNKYDDKWTMITIVIQETNPSNDIVFRNQATVKMYINGYLTMTRNVSGSFEEDKTTAMRQNKGNLYLYPNGDQQVNGLMMADLAYFNYVLTDEEITALYKEDFTKVGMTKPTRMDLSSTDFEKSAVVEHPSMNTIKSI